MRTPRGNRRLCRVTLLGPAFAGDRRAGAQPVEGAILLFFPSREALGHLIAAVVAMRPALEGLRTRMSAIATCSTNLIREALSTLSPRAARNSSMLNNREECGWLASGHTARARRRRFRGREKARPSSDGPGRCPTCLDHQGSSLVSGNQVSDTRCQPGRGHHDLRG